MRKMAYSQVLSWVISPLNAPTTHLVKWQVKQLLMNGLGFKPPGEFGHGDIVIHEGVEIEGYIVDVPGNPPIHTGRNNNIPTGSDVDFFYVNGQWYKIKNGIVHLYLDDCGKVKIQPEQGATMVYPIDRPPVFWYFYDGNIPQDYINMLHNHPTYGPLPDAPIPPLE